MATISEYEKFYSENYTPDKLQICLDILLEKIKFLESIYMTGGENHMFSDNFHDAAYTERQELCQKTSAIYSLLRK